MSSSWLSGFAVSFLCQNHPGRIETSHSGGTQSVPRGSPVFR